MPTQILSAKPVVTELRQKITREVEEFKRRSGRAPKFAHVLVGDHAASAIYNRMKGSAATEVGMEHDTVRFPASATPAEVKAKVAELNRDPKMDGILIQRPLPSSFKEEDVLYWVSPEKDVDAFHPENTGRLSLGLPCFQPCTPAGVMALLKFYKVQTAGKIACVVGRSSIVGKPMATLLLQADATVLHCHSRTPSLATITKQADILVVAAGRPGLIGKEHVKPGAIVVDVGIHRDSEGKVVGDVRAEELEGLASAMTPVPGGVGPMTITLLLENTLRAAQMSLSG